MKRTGKTYCQNILAEGYCDNGLYLMIMDVMHFREKASGTDWEEKYAVVCRE